MSNPEKKWFVYTGIQQEGPLSVDEVRVRIAAGQLLGAHLAWCEGMEGWLKVEEIPALRVLMQPARPVVPSPPPIPTYTSPIAPAAPVDPTQPLPGYAQALNLLSPAPMAPTVAIRPQAPVPARAYVPDDEPETDLTPHGLLAEDDHPRADQITGSHEIIAEPEPYYSPTNDFSDPPNREDLSALIYLKADTGEEKTGNIDARTLKRAEKEAAQVAKVARKSSDDFEERVAKEETSRGARWLRGGLLLVLGGAIGTGLGYGYQWIMLNQHWFRSLPEMPGLRIEERAELQSAITTSLTETPKIALAAIQEGSQPPSFYVASNLPDGALVDIYVHGEPDTLIGRPSFESVLHVKLADGIARSDSLKAEDGSLPPAGNYLVAAAESDSPGQSETVRAALAGISPRAQLPSWVPASRRVVQIKPYTFLVGKSQAEYDTALKSVRAQSAKARLDRLKILADLHDKMNGALGVLHQSLSLAKAGNEGGIAGSKKRWELLLQELKPSAEALDNQARTSGLAGQIALMATVHSALDALNASFALAGTDDKDKLEKSMSDAADKLSDLKKALDQAHSVEEKPSMPAPGGI
jgi:hypothetical protein